MLDFMNQLFAKFADALKSVLPVSPFAPYIDQVKNFPYLRYINWFVPVSEILAVSATWLTAVILFYVYSIILRWIKAIQ